MIKVRKGRLVPEKDKKNENDVGRLMMGGGRRRSGEGGLIFKRRKKGNFVNKCQKDRM